MISTLELEKQFYEVVRNPDSKLRQDFLDRIPLDGTLISRLIYREGIDICGDGVVIAPSNGLVAQMPQTSAFRQFSPIRKRKILVYPHAFSYDFHQKIGDVISTLIDHEAFHLEQLNKHSFFLALRPVWNAIISPKDWEYLVRKDAGIELAAYENQLKNAHLRDLSPKYGDYLEETINEILQKYKPLNKISDKKLFYELVPA